MADLDAALDRQRALAVGRRIAGDDVADIGRRSARSLGGGQVAAPVDAGVVEVRPRWRRRRNRSSRRRSGRRRSAPASRARSVRGSPAGSRSGRRSRPRWRSESPEARHLADLDLVQRRGRRGPAAARWPARRRCRRLQRSVASTSDLTVRRQRNAEQLRHVFAASPCRASASCRSRLRPARRAAADRASPLRPARHWPRSSDGGAVGDRILAGVGDHLELVAGRAADGAGVGGHRAETSGPSGRRSARRRRTSAGSSAARRPVAIERVRVLHRELAPAHHAEPRPALVAELGLDVIEVHRQLPVAAEVLRARCR